MKTETERISTKILERIVPKKPERDTVENLAQKIMSKTEEVSHKSSLNAKVSLEGSVAKDTWLSGEADIDIFLQVDNKLERKDLETTCLQVARKAIKGHKPIERYAEHPYITVDYQINNTKIKIDLVLYFDLDLDYIKNKGPITAVDRSPFHGRFIRDNLTKSQKNDARLLKQFFNI